MTWIINTYSTGREEIIGVRCDGCAKNVMSGDTPPGNWHNGNHGEHLCFGCLCRKYEELEADYLALKTDYIHLPIKKAN